MPFFLEAIMKTLVVNVMSSIVIASVFLAALLGYETCNDLLMAFFE